MHTRWQKAYVTKILLSYNSTHSKEIVINFFVTRIRSHNDLDKICHVTHHHTVIKLRMSGAISLIHPYAFMASTRATITFQRNFDGALYEIIIIIILGISFMQGIYTYILETNHVPREHCVATILVLLFMVFISLVPALTPLYLYVSNFRSTRMCAVPNMAVFCSSLTS